MTFDDFLSAAWADHASNAEEVASRLRSHDATSSAETIALAGLVTHVFGEHLGLYAEGVTLLGAISTFDLASEQAVTRSQAALEVAAGSSMPAGFSMSDQIRILAVASSALASRDVSRASQSFSAALELSAELEPSDPAIRALAVTGNNLATSLEETASRSQAQTELMIKAAVAARRFWELAGTWIHVERAEYRLANTYLKAGDRALALKHAEECLRICLAHNADDFELKYAHEILDTVKRG